MPHERDQAMSWATSLVRRSPAGVSALRGHRSSLVATVSHLSRQRSSLAATVQLRSSQRTPLQQQRHLSSTPAPAPISPAASPAVPGEGSTTASAAGSVNSAKGKDPAAATSVFGEGGSIAGDKPQAAAAVAGGGAATTPAKDKGAGAAVGRDEPWIVGRVLDNADRWLGAKQEKIRRIEVGVIERYASIISTLDGSLEVREGDEFLAWLRSRGFPDPPPAAAATPASSSPCPSSWQGGDKPPVTSREAGDEKNSRFEAVAAAAAERNGATGGNSSGVGTGGGVEAGEVVGSGEEVGIGRGVEAGDGGRAREGVQREEGGRTRWGLGAGAEAGAEGVEGAKKRAEVEAFLVAAAARLNALVAEQEESLFADRGEGSNEAGEGKGGGEGGGEKVGPGSSTEGGNAEEGSVEDAETASLKMPEEELHQARLAAHRAMLCHCLSLVSSSLGKQQLKSGLSLEEVAAATRSAYLAAPNERLEAIFPLFDTHGDGHLDPESVERAMDAVVLPVTVTAQRCYAAAARPSLDKKAAAAMPKTMKYTLWDVLEVPVKRRCAFEWAVDRKQVGPDDWRVSWEQFEPSRRQHFPEFESIASMYVEEYGRRRSAWHNSRKGRKEAAVYGSILLSSVLVMERILSVV